MLERDHAILERFARRIRDAFPEARIWAFGSRARGDATEESDFDICVVFAGMTRDDEAIILHIAWEVAFDNGCLLNVIPLREEDFERGPMAESTLKRNILAEGVPA